MPARRRRDRLSRPTPATRSAATSATSQRSSGSAASAKPTAITISRWCAATSPRSASTRSSRTGSTVCCAVTRPGPYTFLLKASRETPRRLKHERRGTIGLRVPDHPVSQMLLTELGEPVMSSTLLLPGEDCREPMPRKSMSCSSKRWTWCSTAAIADWCRPRSSTCPRGHAEVVRVGRGDVTPFAGAVPYNEAQCGRQSSCLFINNECKHWIYLYFFTNFLIGQFRYSLRLPCMKSHTAGWRDTSATELRRCSGA